MSSRDPGEQPHALPTALERASINDLTAWVGAKELSLIEPKDQEWLRKTFARFAGDYPTLEQLWTLMDEAWHELQCDPDVMDARIAAYYTHPVWLLNGLFIEQHRESLENRRHFTDWVVQKAPRRVADYGGGFGGLARMIGAACPNAVVEVIEPHPHPVAVSRAVETPNVRYQTELSEGYDILIATDVFEHVPDPLGLVAETAAKLSPGGHFLIANCFEPVILCHLPQTFHFRHSWDNTLRLLGLRPQEKVVYGHAFVRDGDLNLEAARRVERRSQRLYRWTRRLSNRLAGPLTRVLI